MESLDALLYRLAYLATADRHLAQDHVRRILSLETRSHPELVTCLIRQLGDELPDQGDDFEHLETVLRTEVSADVDLPQGIKRSDLHWELKVTCLASTLCCLPPGPRLAFILCSVYGASFREATRILRVSQTTVRLRFATAVSSLEHYLEPRCEHLDSRNPCHCDNRLEVALKNRFIDYLYAPAPRTSYRAKRAHGPSELYAHLPILQPSLN